VILLDTTIAVDHLRGDDRAASLLERLANEGEPLLASELSRFELLAGMRPEELDATERFMDALSWVPVNEEIARLAGSMAAEYRRSHRNGDRDRCRPSNDERAPLSDDPAAPAALPGLTHVRTLRPVVVL